MAECSASRHDLIVHASSFNGLAYVTSCALRQADAAFLLLRMADCGSYWDAAPHYVSSEEGSLDQLIANGLDACLCCFM